MPPAIHLLGAKSASPSGNQSLESLIATAVHGMLKEASVDLAQIDTVVATGNEQIDGGISPLIMSEATGSLGHSYLFVTGGAGEVMKSALALLESGMARTVIVVGWAQMTKDAVDDLAPYSTDPLFHFPMGLDLRHLVQMHIDRLVAGGIGEAEAERYATAMKARATFPARLPDHPWMPNRVDRATALLLSRDLAAPVRLTGFVRMVRPLVPEVDDLDPRRWVRDAVASPRDDEIVQITAPNAYCELAALEALGHSGRWQGLAGYNRDGGGLAAWSGAVDGLARIQAAWTGLKDRQASQALVLEMTGPLGQSVSATQLARGAS